MPRRCAVLSALAALALGACGREPPEPAPPSGWPVTIERASDRPPEFERVVLVTIDTLRADHVSCYGYPRRTTPFLDSLAARGARFTRAMASVSHTTPSHATMLTGLVPAVHGVLQNGHRLDARAHDLAGLFERCGFETAAFLNVKFLAGICGSFGTVEVRALAPDGRILDGSHVVDAALRWLAPSRGAFFAWVHLYDPHKWKDRVLEHGESPEPIWSGETPPRFLETLAELHGLPAPEPGEPYTVRWNVEKKAGEKLDVASGAGFLRCIDAYDELTLFADRQLERLYRAVEELGLPGRTLWVVTADHGEGLASHGVAGHGGRIYQEQLHVPLVLHASDGSIAPVVVDELVSHVDLLPTLAATLGARVDASERIYEGRSLWPLVRGEPGAWTPRALFAQRRPAEDASDPDQSEIYSLQDGRAKYILHEPGADEFFDLEADPRELTDLGEGSPRAAGLRAELEERLELLRALTPGGDEDVPEEWMEELRALGYVR